MRICYVTAFYMVATGIMPEDGTGFYPLVRLLLAIGIYGAWGVVVNDYVDMDVDLAAGKKTRIERVPAWQIKAVLVALPVISFLILPRPASNPWVLAILASCYILAFFYSAPKGRRLKEKGAWGFLADVVLEKPLPSLMMFAYFQHVGLDVLILAVFYSSIGAFYLALHQIADYDSDLEAGIRTLAVTAGKDRLRKFYSWALVPLFFASEACVLALLVLRVQGVGVVLGIGFVLGGVVLAYLVRRGIVHRYDPIRPGMSAEVWYFFTFSEGPLPTVLGLAAVIQAPIYLPILLALLVSQVYLVMYQYRWALEKVISSIRSY